MDIINILLSDPRVDPLVRENESIQCAAAKGSIEAIRMLMGGYRIDPIAFNDVERIFISGKKIKNKKNNPCEWILQLALAGVGVGTVKMLLAGSSVEYNVMQKDAARLDGLELDTLRIVALILNYPCARVDSLDIIRDNVDLIERFMIEYNRDNSNREYRIILDALSYPSRNRS